MTNLTRAACILGHFLVKKLKKNGSKFSFLTKIKNTIVFAKAEYKGNASENYGDTTFKIAASWVSDIYTL